MFNYSGVGLGALQNNPAHQFAMKHALQHYSSGAIYSFIPKNGCSTMRLSLAIANGLIAGVEQGHWIHNNNHTFNPSLACAATSPYKFIILRCPYRRLGSFFLDKMVSKEPEAWVFRNNVDRQLDLDELSFEKFVKLLSENRVRKANIHWRQQSDFLLYKSYDEYFAFENFDYIAKQLQSKIRLEVLDARELTGHGTEKLKKINDSCSKMTLFELLLLKREGLCPDYLSLYTEEIFELVSELYREDIQLYRSHFNSGMLF